jgi:hypothetical protein
MASAVLATPAHADDAETRIAHAYRRFHDGEHLFEAKKFDEACAAFEESQRLDPTLGTLLNMAYCHETLGKSATAWREYNDAAAWAAQQSRADREKFALDHATDLAKRLSRVQLDLPVDVDGIAVEIDGRPNASARATSILFLDPGQHALRVTAPGKQPYVVQVTVSPGPSSQVVHVPLLSNAIGTVHVSPTPGAGGDAPVEGTRTAGLVVVGLGVVGLGVGTYFGVRTLDQKSTGRAHCVGSQCDEVGVAALDDAHTSATISTVAFSAGFVALGAGLWLMLRRPTPDPPPATARARVRPMVGARGVGVGMEGSW